MAMFSEEFKNAAVQKYLSRGSRSVTDICEELGISDCSLYNWSQIRGKSLGMSNAKRRPQDWDAVEKMNAVIEFEKLDPGKQGEFLRKQGLHSDHIVAWKKSMQAGLESPIDKKASRKEMSQLKAENKELSRDLNKKDKALAAVTALLVLKKKADLLWGTGENE